MCDVKPLLVCQRRVKELEAQIIELEKLEPVIPIPQITKWGIQRHYLVQFLEQAGIGAILEDEPFVFDTMYYYTDLEGWGEVLYDLVFASELYNPIFDCDKYALRAYIECCLRHKMNTLLPCLGTLKDEGHAFNIFPHGDETGFKGLKLWEANEGLAWSGEIFEIGEHNYKPVKALI